MKFKGKKIRIEEEEELYESENSGEFEEESEDDQVEENSHEISEGISGESNDESEDDDSEAEIYKKGKTDENQNLEEDHENFVPTNEEIKVFNANMNNIHTSLEEVNKKMNQLLVNIRTPGKAEMKYGISFLDGKNNIMLTYLTNLLFYALLKTNGISIKNHDVIKKLVYYKTLLERSKVIDLKLKTQIDRLLKLGEKDLKEFEENQIGEKKVEPNSNKNNNENYYRPRILDQEDEEKEDNGSEEEENSVYEKNDIDKKKLKYKVQKNFQEFFETTEENKTRQKKIQKMKEKIRNSEYYKELKDSFMETPKEIQSHNTEYEKFMNQVEDYENENFQRVKISKRDLKIIKKKDKRDNDFDDIGKEFKNFDRILKNETEEEFNEERKFLNSKRMAGPSRGGRGRGRGNSKFRGSFRGKGRKTF